ncbi:uncharacterized protein METZ01_LOCUS393660 [marine metagenome]|uniref:Uncharacterized protein n=1 Tax=marine metagenome TaxID=408172 RepID=A0A382V2M0_9ZZZZ
MGEDSNIAVECEGRQDVGLSWCDGSQAKKSQATR